MTRLRVSCFALSLDGYGAGPRQDLENPLGVGGLALHEWAFATRSFRQIHGGEGGTTGVDDEFIRRGMENIGAWILGRNMFGPVRGPWPDGSWKGWWGETPPYHTSVYVLTHHARPSLEMKGGTTFHFVTEGIHAAWERARKSAQGKDVRLGGGVQTIQEYLRAGLVEEMHLAIAPVLLGAGEGFFAGLNVRDLGFQCTRQVAGEGATHVVLVRRT
jgi:dihydrofolate reductase